MKKEECSDCGTKILTSYDVAFNVNVWHGFESGRGTYCPKCWVIRRNKISKKLKKK